ncbi:cholinesterase-like [Oppia nitens]|uniref:cholinesterase-like n=1 Tax=Oppia nitens TaxID=1686743 RepID=UPI0023DBEED6|nr:cholinesterase-like [Oppia nitens]
MGLFKRAIMQSGAHMYNKDRDPLNKTEALNNAKKIATNFNCSLTHDWIQCLRKVDANLLVKMLAPFGLTFPVVGTEFLPQRQAFEHNLFNSDIDLIGGITKDEGQIPFEKLGVNITYDSFKLFANFFNELIHNLNINNVNDFYMKNVNKTSIPAIERALGEFLGDLVLKCPTYQFVKQVAKRLSTTGRNVYFYELTYASPYYSNISGCDTKSKNVCHAQDIAFVFGLPLLTPEIYLPKDIFFASNVMIMWTNFAKTGIADLNWPKLLNNSTPNVWHILDLSPNNIIKTFDHLLDQTCDGFWKNYNI